MKRTLAELFVATFLITGWMRAAGCFVREPEPVLKTTIKVWPLPGESMSWDAGWAWNSRWYELTATHQSFPPYAPLDEQGVREEADRRAEAQWYFDTHMTSRKELGEKFDFEKADE